jgi:hypothetical protein
MVVSMNRHRGWRIRELLLAAALLVPTLAFCQSPADSSSTQDPGSTNPPPQTQVPDTGPGPEQSQPNAAGGTQGLFARALNSASPLAGANGPLQWGWLSVRSISFQQEFTNVTSDGPGAQSVTQDLQASQLTVALVLSHAFGSSRQTHLTVQYTPSLFIVEGHVYTNALNQTAGLDTGFQLNPRWSLQISDRLNYLGSQRNFSGFSLDANYLQGTVAQNTFINGPGTVIYDTAGATFTYLWSPITTVSFTPTFSYQVATGAVNFSQNLGAYYGGGRFTLSRSLSATQTIGISYSGQYGWFTNTSTTAGPQSNGLEQDALIRYGQQIGPSWRLSLGFGVTSNSAGYAQAGFAANAGITKSFQRMDFALSYVRGHQFNGYITSGSTDRIDLINTIHWSRRFLTTTSGAYFRTANSPNPGPSGTYATEQLSFALTRAFRLTGGIAYTKQTGDGVYVQGGKSRLATVGITWAPPADSPH